MPFYYAENKTFIEKESPELFKSLKDYFFDFINSNTFMEILSNPCYENAKEFLSNTDTIKRILFNDKYLKFIPLNSSKYSGFTNKDLLISIVQAYPSIVQNLPIEIKKEDLQNIRN